MLAAENRLRRPADFEATVRRGRRSGRRSLVVHVTEGPRAMTGSARTLEPLVGFVVSRAVGGAVVRNTVKRKLRGLLRDRLARFPGGTMIVVRALPQSSKVPYRTLAADLDSALATLGLGVAP